MIVQFRSLIYRRHASVPITTSETIIYLLNLRLSTALKIQCSCLGLIAC